MANANLPLLPVPAPSSLVDTIIKEIHSANGNVSPVPTEPPIEEIVRALWPDSLGGHQITIDHFSAFSRYYTRICGKVVVAEQMLRRRHSNSPSFLSKITHQHLIDALMEAYRDPESKKSDVVQSLTKQTLFDGNFVSAEVCSILEIAVTIGLMVEVHTLQGSKSVWKGDQTLDDFVRVQFLDSPSQLEKQRNIIDLHWERMEKYAYILVVETRDLSEHLSIKPAWSESRNKYTVLRIFDLCECLQALSQYPAECNPNVANSPRRNAYPKAFLEETLQTIALILRGSKEKHFRQGFSIGRLNICSQKRLANFNKGVLKLGARTIIPFDLESYPHWGKRLEKVLGVYLESKPKSIWSYYSDKRNPREMWTFRIAFVVFIMTLFSLLLTAASLAVAVVQLQDARKEAKKEAGKSQES